MKTVVFLLFAVFLAGCVQENLEVSETDVDGGIIERADVESDVESIAAENQAEEQEKSDWVMIVNNQTDIHRGLYVHFNGVFIDPSSRKLYFPFDAEDRFENKVARDALQWNAFIYFSKGDTIKLFLCNFENNGTEWKNEYCEPEENIPQKWFDQNVWIIYTLNTAQLINDNSILDIMGREYTFAFKTKIPKQ